VCDTAAGIDASEMMMDDLPPGVDVPVPPLGEMRLRVFEYRLLSCEFVSEKERKVQGVKNCCDWMLG